MPLLIEHYGLIGGRKTAALVGADGSIDWLCWPRFDSGACFAALLGGPEHDRWLIAPRDAATARQRYQDNTLILETSFENEDGAIDLVDFMPETKLRSDQRDANLGFLGARFPLYVGAWGMPFDEASPACDAVPTDPNLAIELLLQATQSLQNQGPDCRVKPG